MIESLSALLLPTVVALTGALMLFGKKDYFGAFTKGAREGLRTTVQLLPTLTALMVAISMLNACGIVETVAELLGPAADRIGLPAELLPLLITRPFSGSAATATYTQLLEQVGADSLPGLCASVIFGSSDTVVYIASVYFSAVGVRRTRYCFPVAVAIMLFCVFFSCFLCRIWFF
ncbi:MAG: spore maturation protein [Clostridia bacterium]|nr:spore maturation protein [Clostridia bacterium]